jgi:hypothetical protein
MVGSATTTTVTPMTSTNWAVHSTASASRRRLPIPATVTGTTPAAP